MEMPASFLSMLMSRMPHFTDACISRYKEQVQHMYLAPCPGPCAPAMQCMVPYMMQVSNTHTKKDTYKTIFKSCNR